MNNCNFAGRIGGDAEVRTTPAGKTVTSFSLAVDEYAGEGKRGTLWIKCAMFGERGQNLAQYLTKGSAISVCGQVSIDQWTGTNGDARADLKLFVEKVTLQGSKSDGGNGQASSQSAPQGQQSHDDTPIPF